MDLKNKVVVITGGSSGIGKELGFQFARKGSLVVLGARRLDYLRNNVDQINREGGQAIYYSVDVQDRHQMENLAQKAFERFGRLDIFINNAGASHARGRVMENKEGDIRSTMDTNFMGSVYGVWAAVPYMEKSGGGQLVFISSCVGKRGVALNAAYCASKFAIQGFTEALRPELKSKKIKVITICPPGVDTPFFEVNGRGGKKNYRLHKVEKIARMIVKACEKEKREVLLTLDSKLLHWGNVFFPKLVDFLVAKDKKV